MLQLVIVLVTGCLVGLDQLTKWLASTYCYERVVVWDGVLSLQYTTNTGAAWGSFDGQTWLLVGVTSLMVIGLLAVLLSGRFRKHKMANIGAILVVSGGIGNLIDRINVQFVVDFLRFDFMDFPVFNVADIFVVCGSITLFIYFVFFYSDKSNSKDKLTGKEQKKNLKEEEALLSENNDLQVDVGIDGAQTDVGIDGDEA